MCNESQIYEILHYILLTCSVPSVISCLFMIFAYLRIRNLQSSSLRIVFWMSINDLIRNGFYMIPIDYLKNKNICVIYGIVINTALTNNSVWAMFIVIALYQVMFSYERDVERYFKYAFFITLVLVPAYHISAMSTNSFGFNYGICTFKGALHGLIWRSVQEGFILATVVVDLVLYAIIYRKQQRFKMLTLKEVIFDKGMIFVLITMITITFLMLFRYVEIGNSICKVYILGIMSSITISLHGFFNFLGVISNSNIRRAIKESFCKASSEEDMSIFTAIY